MRFLFRQPRFILNPLELADQIGLFGRAPKPHPDGPEGGGGGEQTVTVHAHIRQGAHGYEQVKEHEAKRKRRKEDYDLRGVLAGAYRGKDISERELLHHRYCEGDDKTLCKRVKADSVGDALAPISPDAKRCPECEARHAKLEGVDKNPDVRLEVAKAHAEPDHGPELPDPRSGIAHADVIGKPITIRVAAGRLDEFKATMGELAKRAEKLGVEGPAYTIGEPYDYTREVKQDGEDLRRTTRAVDITVDPKPIKLSGWNLAGSVELRHSEQLPPNWKIADWAVGQIPERYRDGKPHCDHCALDRKRRLCFIVKHAAGGEWKQVGGDCVKDFLGHDPQHLAAIMGLYDSVKGLGNMDEDDGESFGGGGGQRYHDTTEALALGIALSRMNGFVSGKDAYATGAQSTASDVRGILNARGRDDNRVGDAIRRSPHYAKGVARAPEIIAWGKGLPTGAIGSYEDKLRLAFQNEHITDADVGVVVSALASFERHATEKRMVDLRSRANEVGHLGKVGDKIGTRKLSKKDRDLGAQLHAPREVECIGVSSIDGTYGTTHILKFVDPEGHLLTWFSSKPDAAIEHAVLEGKPETRMPWWGDRGAPGRYGMYREDVQPGRRYLLDSATIKAHDEFRGDKQTIITRGNLVPQPSELEVRTFAEPERRGMGMSDPEDREQEVQFTLGLAKKLLEEAGAGALRFPEG